jgi:hypothetical protein
MPLPVMALTWPGQINPFMFVSPSATAFIAGGIIFCAESTRKFLYAMPFCLQYSRSIARGEVVSNPIAGNRIFFC